MKSERGAANSRNLARLALRGMYQIEVHNADLVPKRGRLIVAANHVAAFDGPLLFGTAPRPIHILAKTELFSPPFDRILSAAGQIPLDYEGADRDGMQAALQVLYRESAIGIFPEAHRGDGNFASMRHGIAYLQSRSNAPIVPVALFGTRPDSGNLDDFPRLRSKLYVYYGKPFLVPPVGDIDYRATLASIGETIRQQLADHVTIASKELGIVDTDPWLAPANG